MEFVCLFMEKFMVNRTRQKSTEKLSLFCKLQVNRNSFILKDTDKRIYESPCTSPLFETYPAISKINNKLY